MQVFKAIGALAFYYKTQYSTLVRRESASTTSDQESGILCFIIKRQCFYRRKPFEQKGYLNFNWFQPELFSFEFKNTFFYFKGMDFEQFFPWAQPGFHFRGEQFSKGFKKSIMKIAKMYYFSIFFKKSNKQFVPFLLVWTKNSIYFKF